MPIRKKTGASISAWVKSFYMKKIYLEFLRGISTVFIIGWHMAFLAPTGHVTHLTAYWGTDALIMFFMLSGLVINLSESKRPKTVKEFTINRLVRIYPQFIMGMLLAFIALWITHTAIPSTKDIIGNFLMVSTMKDYMGYIATSIQSNLPVWSLSFEMAFYLMFALTIGKNQQRTVRIWFALTLIAIAVFFLRTNIDPITHVVALFAFSSVWIVGYYIYQYRHYFYARKYAVLFSLGILPLISRMQFSANFYDPLKYFIFSIFAIPFFSFCLQEPPRGKEIKLKYLVPLHLLIVIGALIFPYMPFKNTIVYSTLPYVYMAAGYLIHLFKLKERVITLMTVLGKVLGKYSYSLYISHYTVLFVFSKLLHNVPLYCIVSIPPIIFFAYALESWLQPAVTRLFSKKEQQQMHLQPAGFPEMKINHSH